MGIFQWIKSKFKAKKEEPIPTPRQHPHPRFYPPMYVPPPQSGTSGIGNLATGAALGYLLSEAGRNSGRSQDLADYTAAGDAPAQPIAFDPSLDNTRLGSDLSSDGIQSVLDSPAESSSSFGSSYSSHDTDSSWSSPSSSSSYESSSSSSSYEPSSSSCDSGSSSSGDW